MTGLKKNSRSDLDRVKADAASDMPVGYDPESDLYDPADPNQVKNFFETAQVMRRQSRGDIA